MFSLWGKRGDQTETLPSGIIEMKGSEPQSQAPRKQWRGLWSSWDGSSDNKSVKPKQSPDLVGRSNSYPQPSILRATVLSDNEATSSNTDVMGCECTQNNLAQSLTPPQDNGISTTEDADFYEVQMLVKIPKPKKPCEGSADQEKLIEDLRKGLQETQKDCQKALRALDTKTKECKDLVSVVRELTESRSQLTAFKAIQTERFEDLQQEHVRVLRIVELSRAISKENIAKSSQTMHRLNQVEEELARQRLIVQQTKERLARQKLDNLELKERLNMLERLDLLAFRRESACMVKLQQFNLKETY